MPPGDQNQGYSTERLRTGGFEKRGGNKGGTCIWSQPGFLRIYHPLVTISVMIEPSVASKP